MSHMRRWVRRLLWVVGVLGVLGVSAYYAAPHLVRWYVREHYAGITLNGAIEIDWLGAKVVFRNVLVERTGIKGQLEKVRVEKDRSVYVDGGQLRIDLDELRKGDDGGGTSSGTTVVAAGLAVEVHKGETQATVEDASIGPEKVCFKSGVVRYAGFEATVLSGCLKRDKSEFHAVRVDIPVKLPFNVPRLDTDQTIVITELTADLIDKVVRFDSAGVDAFTAKGSASVKLADDVVFFDAARVDVNHPWVAPTPVHLNRVAVTAPLTLFRGGEGKLRVQIDKTVVRIDPNNWTVDGEGACNDWIGALPHPLPKALEQAKGNFEGFLSFDVRAKPTPHLEIKYDCKFKCSAEPIKSVRRSQFTYFAYNSKGELFERKTGSQTANWTSLADLPSYVPEAFRLMEDPGFHSHKGIHIMALVNSLKANLAKGKFVKGGSTITMQLAKNLFLRRHKTVGRKAQEALLTIALESCMSKARIMELYMNVVEYGPDIYGLRAATQHYFRKDPSVLSADEAFYMASILPAPKDAVHPKYGGMERTKRLMQRLATSGYISEYLVPVEEEAVDTTGWETVD